MLPTSWVCITRGARAIQGHLLPSVGPAHNELVTSYLPILQMEKQALRVELSCPVPLIWMFIGLFFLKTVFCE